MITHLKMVKLGARAVDHRLPGHCFFLSTEMSSSSHHLGMGLFPLIWAFHRVNCCMLATWYQRWRCHCGHGNVSVSNEIVRTWSIIPYKTKCSVLPFIILINIKVWSVFGPHPPHFQNLIIFQLSSIRVSV